MVLGNEPNHPHCELERRSQDFIGRLWSYAQYCVGPFAPRKCGLITKVGVKGGYLTQSRVGRKQS